MTAVGGRVLTPEQVAQKRATRRHPRLHQLDWLHIVQLVDDLRPALAELSAPGGRVLDVFCGSRPYEDLLPPGCEVVGMDVADTYGTADIVTSEFLPGPDNAYDAITCIEAFHYVPGPRGVAEMMRVLRPGGRLLVSIPTAWEWDLESMEYRYTEPELHELFAAWDDVEVHENGGRAVLWTLMTGAMLHAAERRVARGPLKRLATALFSCLYVALNGLGWLLDRVERPRAHPTIRMPANLMVTARKPAA
jgi:SAM-dependent methyltransferase